MPSAQYNYISNMCLQNFKCFGSQELPLSQINIFTGYNGAGKSSFIQGLLFLFQYLRSNPINELASLNGPLTRLGTFGETLFENPSSNNILLRFEISNSSGSTSKSAGFTFAHVKRELENILSVITLDMGDEHKPILDSMSPGIEDSYYLERLRRLLSYSKEGDKCLVFRDLVSIAQNMIFISADRVSQRDVFPSVTSNTLAFADVGINGEYAPWWIDKYSDMEVDKKKVHLSDKSPILQRQINAWASEIFPGVQVNTQIVEKANLVKLELRISELQDWKRPSNIGYGISYSIPIIAAGLLAKRGQILIVDSPEAHLHPAGQSKMGRFLATIASSGVQVLVETHSDHLVNGIRLAVKDRVIEKEKVLTHFFETIRKDNEINNQVTTLHVDNNGSLSDWPEGFFDQSDKDLTKLIQ